MQVKWSDNALEELSLILEYGALAFGERAAERLYGMLLENEARLATNPYIGKLEPLLKERPQGFRSLVVHKNYKLIYYIEDETVYIATLFDNRRNPAVMTDHLK